MDNISTPSFHLVLTAEQTEQLFKAIEPYIKRLIRESNSEAPEPEPTPRYLTRREVRDLLHISYPTLDSYTAKGLLNRTRIGNRVLYDAAEISQALAGNMRLKVTAR